MMQRYKIFSPFPNISAIIFPFFLNNFVFDDMVSDVSFQLLNAWTSNAVMIVLKVSARLCKEHRLRVFGKIGWVIIAEN